jgi:hypothetical protein
MVAPIVHFIQGVQDASLDGLEPVFDRRYRPLQNNVAGVIEEIILVHALQGRDLVFVVGGMFPLGFEGLITHRLVSFQ